MEIENEDIQYLYKILSLRNWEVTHNQNRVVLSQDDDAFIHFSTEDQLERIIAKYWSDAKQLVILKINKNKLEGNLVFETNPGGVTKYFHLYDGSIPVSSIIESKILYREPPQSIPDLYQLDIVKIGDPVLRKCARELSREEILSPEIQTSIEEMKKTMRVARGIGLAAPQVGKSIQLIVIEDVNHSHLNAKQLEERDRHPVPFQVVINPRIYFEESSSVEFFEGCLSMPGFVGIVPRAQSVRVECLNERAEPIVIHAKGWYARILQHEIDHLNGVLYIDRVILSTLMTEENYIKLWKEKSISEVQNGLYKESILISN